jgi:hypothetical protein
MRSRLIDGRSPKMSEAREDILASIPLFMMFSMDGVDSNAEERMSTHPSGIRRIVDFAKVVEQGMNRVGPLSKYAEDENAQRQWRRMAAKLKELRSAVADYPLTRKT